MARKLKTEILETIRAAKYFSISVDSTPGLAHIDQLTFIIRYVNNTGIPKETFLAFIPNPGHKSEELEVAVVNFIEENGLNLNNCHGQSYDNASNMSGHYSGLQARLKERNPFIDYVPCAAHSLNLIGSCASESCQEATSFFSTLQELYNFFTASTHRWQIFVSVNKDKKFLTLKTLSKTRWSARHDACEALSKQFPDIIKALNQIASDPNEKSVTKSEARGLVQKLNKFETAILAKLWTSILGRFNVVNKKLQSINIDLASVVSLYNSLTEFLKTLRTDFSSFENLAKSCSDIQEYQFDLKHTKKNKFQFDVSHAGETAFENGSHHFKINTFYVIIDNLQQELSRRKIVYENLLSHFHFLEKIKTAPPHEIRQSANNLLKMYSNELEDCFVDECINFGAHLSTITNEKLIPLMDLSKLIYERDLQEIYPNVLIALRIFLCKPATNCSGERSFSTLRRVKNYLRSSISEDRLNSLALMYIEGETFRSMDLDSIIDSFAAMKSRKKVF